MRFLLLALAGLLLSATAQAQWQAVDNPDGTHACRHQPDGATYPSGNLSAKYSLAVCNSWNRYPVTISPERKFALDLDPTCTAIPQLAVKIGTPLVTPALTSCYTGDEQVTAKFELFDASGGPAPHGFAIDPISGVITNPALGPAASGTVAIRRTTASGVRIEFLRNWAVQQ